VTAALDAPWAGALRGSVRARALPARAHVVVRTIAAAAAMINPVAVTHRLTRLRRKSTRLSSLSGRAIGSASNPRKKSSVA
jgi:hypothetical protein